MRALYTDAPILLLDEPSSALDAVAEAALVDACRRWCEQGRTIFIATHASAFIDLADVIVTLAGGRVVDAQDRTASVEPPAFAVASA